MKLKHLTFTTKDLLHQTLAKAILDLVKIKPSAILGLATGKTFVPVYHALVDAYEKQHLDSQPISFAHTTTFNLDEYIGVLKRDPGSFYSYMQTHVFSKINIHPKNTHLPRACTPTESEEEAVRYENLILAHDTIDLQVLGMGMNGHIGFNEPGSSFKSLTRVVDLSESTRHHNQSAFPNGTMPTQAITMGLDTIMRAKKIILVVTGLEKQAILETCLKHPNTEYPASILLHHSNCEVWTAF